LAALDMQNSRLAANSGLDFVALRPSSLEPQVVFIPIAEFCVVAVHIAAIALPQLIVRETELPYDSRALLVRDTSAGALIRRMAKPKAISA
jgi:hypothetical protein